MSRKKQQEQSKGQEDFTILRLTITKLVEDNAGVKKREIFELKYKNVNDAKAMSQKINLLLNNPELTFICFGPDDSGKQKCFNKAEIDDVLCEFIEDPQIEKAKTLLQEIKEKVDKITEKQHEHIPWHPSPTIVPLYTCPEPRRFEIPTVVTYMVPLTPDSTGQWYWTSGTKLTTKLIDNSDANLTDSTTSTTFWNK